jgi:hypothetical protein
MANEEKKVKGLDGARTIMEMILKTANVSAEWVSESRVGDSSKVSNRQIIDYLAEGNDKSKGERIKRDIRPNEKDAEKIAKDFVNEIAKKMKIAGKVDAGDTGVSREKAAKQGVVSAMRKAAKAQSKLMYDRVKNMKTNDGSKAHPVGKKYAAQRKRLHGVAESVVYVATAQLANALQKGKIKINFGKASKGGLVKATKGF